MSKDPAFLFYSSDFLTGTMLMTHEQTGKYIRLLCLQHQKGWLTEKDMIGICGSHDEDVFSKFVIGDDGRYYNVRLETEVLRRTAYSESRRQNRRKKPEDVSNTSESYVPHMETETITEPEPKKEERSEEGRGKRLDFGFIGFSQEMVEALKYFSEMRTKMKKPLTQRALELAVRSVVKLANGDERLMIEIVNQSTANGWLGFFALKNSGTGRNGSRSEVERILDL